MAHGILNRLRNTEVGRGADDSDPGLSDGSNAGKILSGAVE